MNLRPSHRNGTAVLAVLALLGILSLYVLVNARTLSRLKHDVKQIEQRQVQRRAVSVRPALAADLLTVTNLSGVSAASPTRPKQP